MVETEFCNFTNHLERTNYFGKRWLKQNANLSPFAHTVFCPVEHAFKQKLSALFVHTNKGAVHTYLRINTFH